MSSNGVDWGDYKEGLDLCKQCAEDFLLEYPEAEGTYNPKDTSFKSVLHEAMFDAFSRGWIKAYASKSADWEKPLFSPMDAPFKPQGMEWDDKMLFLYAGMCMGEFTKFHPNATMEEGGMAFVSPVVQQQWSGFREGWWSQQESLIMASNASSEVYGKLQAIEKVLEDKDFFLKNAEHAAKELGGVLDELCVFAGIATSGHLYVDLAPLLIEAMTDKIQLLQQSKKMGPAPTGDTYPAHQPGSISESLYQELKAMGAKYETPKFVVQFDKAFMLPDMTALKMTNHS